METIVKKEMEVVTRHNKIHPKKLALWVGLVSLVMMFTALTSAYVVRRAAGNWLEFDIPSIFYWNTLVIVVSSLTLHAAYGAFKREAAFAYRSLLTVTFILGIAFVVLQYLGWEQLAAEGADLILSSRRPEALEAVAKDLFSRYGIKVQCAAIDLTDSGQLDAFCERIRTEFKPDILLLNAGGPPPSTTRRQFSPAARLHR